MTEQVELCFYKDKEEAQKVWGNRQSLCCECFLDGGDVFIET